MILKGFYNDFEFTQFCIINNVSPILTAPRGNSFFINPNVSGSDFRRSILGQIKLEIDITIPRNVMENLDQLNKIFAVSEPKKLYLSDRYDRYLSCIVDGEIKLSSSNKLGKAKITVISPDYYWRSRAGYIETKFNDSSLIVDNKGTAHTPPIFDVHFKSDCGYLNIISPEGYIALGNPLQGDGVDLPPIEMALTDTFKTSNNKLPTWTQVKNAETYIPDYIKMSSQGTGSVNADGMTLNTATVGSDDKWHGHAIIKKFDTGEFEQTADNFELSSRVDVSNMGGTSNTCAMLIVVMDSDNKPIMTTSVYDVSNGKNELTVTFKIPEENNPMRSKIIYTGKLNVLNGYIKMSKQGNRFGWEVYSDKTTHVSNTVLRVGQTAHIKKTCTHAETGHPILKGYHDLTYTIGAIKTGRDGTKAYRMANLLDL